MSDRDESHERFPDPEPLRAPGGVPGAQPQRRGLADWQIRRVSAYVHEHLADDICLQDLADAVNLTRFHFCTAFRMATGQTPLVWLTGRRMAFACSLLSNPGMPVAQVALAVGYQTPSSFAAAFRRVVGTTPTAFRRAL